MKSTHTWLSDMLGGCPYVRTYVTHTHFCEKLDLDPWALDPSPPIFSSKQLNPQPWRPQDNQIRPISVPSNYFKTRNAAIAA